MVNKTIWFGKQNKMKTEMFYRPENRLKPIIKSGTFGAKVS